LQDVKNMDKTPVQNRDGQQKTTGIARLTCINRHGEIFGRTVPGGLVPAAVQQHEQDTGTGVPDPAGPGGGGPP